MLTQADIDRERAASCRKFQLNYNSDKPFARQQGELMGKIRASEFVLRNRAEITSRLLVPFMSICR